MHAEAQYVLERQPARWKGAIERIRERRQRRGNRGRHGSARTVRGVVDEVTAARSRQKCDPVLVVAGGATEQWSAVAPPPAAIQEHLPHPYARRLRYDPDGIRGCRDNMLRSLRQRQPERSAHLSTGGRERILLGRPRRRPGASLRRRRVSSRIVRRDELRERVEHERLSLHSPAPLAELLAGGSLVHRRERDPGHQSLKRAQTRPDVTALHKGERGHHPDVARRGRHEPGARRTGNRASTHRQLGLAQQARLPVHMVNPRHARTGARSRCRLESCE